MGGTRKIWVRRPGSSATTIQISEADLVDDVRDMILRKYANSLGRQFDSPDLTLSITPRESHRPERVLGPEEPMARTLDAYFPGGQTVEDALIVDIPVRRTPRPSPRTGPPHAQHLTSVLHEEVRPAEAATDYFGPGAESGASDQIPASAMSHDAGLMTNGNTHPATNGAINGAHAPTHPHAISVLSTGQVPQIPSPGGTRTRQYRDRPDRPRLGRQHTSSPTIIGNAIHGTHSIAGVSVPPIQTQATHQQTHAHAPESSRAESHSNATDINTTSSAAGGHQNPPPPAPPLPTPPVPESDATMTQASQNQAQAQAQQAVATPPARVASPRPSAAASKQLKKKKAADNASLSSVMLGGGVPPINVLIVEDNIINLRLLEAFVKRLKVRWSTAMDGREAVAKWRTGGFHLVLMDIQLPIMSGLEATREIRRLERLNSIGAFSMAEDGQSGAAKAETSEEDKLKNREAFKSPVIIVALTASSLQSDRHEALAAGCNDFLTKPVTYVWLERKVMEWGCMQALIDFDGWRKWKLFSQNKPESADEAAAAARKAKAKKNRLSVTAPPSEVQQ
ncbi:hypothetical protein B0H63DRAFT_401200 [Podospora didyma]|uniref:Response regulatory domain-containing protein n=1 Tax=Podospora didyma TaxID=330526 RepID=A0AAE0N5Y4_9PEZI|nr:hypothetical protein B0H63DRAFT_401200 [Podospora didyma]